MSDTTALYRKRVRTNRLALMLSTFSWVAFNTGGWLALLFLFLTLLGARDTQQDRKSVV